MRTYGKRRSAVLAALSAMLLMGSSVSYAAESTAPAETVVENRPDVVKIENQHVGYIDEETGTVYYNVSGHLGNEYWNAIVEQKPEGTMSRWGEGLSWFAGDTVKDAPEVWIQYNVNMESQRYYYNASDDSLHEGPNFISSPNGKWGYVEQRQYTLDGQERYYYWMRGMDSGEITEWFENIGYTKKPFWTPDNRMIVERYSHKDHQYEIAAYDPASKQWDRVRLGSLQGYNAEENLMLYVGNDPARSYQVYDLRTKQSSPLLNDAEREALFTGSQPTYDEQLKLDADLDIWKLPVHPIAVVRDRWHSIHVDGEEIAVPYVINYKGTRWIPIRQLAETLHWKLKIQTRQAGSKAIQYRYTIQVGSRQIELTPENSKIFNDRVFMTQSQLKTLGYSEISITSNQ